MNAEQVTARKDREAALNAHICAMVRERRLDLGVLQTMVAAHLGLAESSFSRYESGQRMLSAAMLCLIAAYLKQPISAFVPEEFTCDGIPALPNGSAPEQEAFRHIVQALQQHPDLIPTVAGLLETLLPDTSRSVV